MAIDAKTLYAALDDLRPIRRQVFILWTWEAMSASDIVHWFATIGIRLDVSQVMNHVFEASSHCVRRRREAEYQRSITGAMPH